MTLCRRAIWVVTMLAGCGSSPPPPGETGGAGGSAGSGGAGGTLADAAPPRPDAGVPTADGSGATPPAPDAAIGDAPAAPPSGPEQPLPPCKKTTPVGTGAELGPAVAGAQPGDCVVLADGSYTFPTITRIGTADAPIVIRAASRGKAVVSAGVIHLLNSEYVVLEGLDITTPGAASTFLNGGSNGMLIALTDCRYCRLTRNRIHPSGAAVERDWIVISGADAHHNRIDHNELGPQTVLANMLVVEGTGQETPLTYGKVSQYNRVDHNYFHDINNTGGNNWETMRIGRSWQGPTKGFNVIEYNLLKGTTGDPETISVKSSANIIRHNTMRATTGEITLRHGNGTQVYGNYILADGNNSSRGMRVYGADHRIFNNYVAAGATGIWLDDGSATPTDEPGAEHYRVYRTWVFNNTIVGQDIRVGGSKAYAPLDCRVANNIVTGSGQLNPDGTSIVSEGNLVGGANPLTMQDGLYRLLPNAAGALAIDKAVNASFYAITDDIHGQPRSANVDLGADEHSEAPVTTPGPLTTADVGPDAP
jgi:poly(beta-D-mannuronate) lyase